MKIINFIMFVIGGSFICASDPFALPAGFLREGEDRLQDAVFSRGQPSVPMSALRPIESGGAALELVPTSVPRFDQPVSAPEPFIWGGLGQLEWRDSCTLHNDSGSDSTSDSDSDSATTDQTECLDRSEICARLVARMNEGHEYDRMAFCGYNVPGGYVNVEKCALIEGLPNFGGAFGCLSVWETKKSGLARLSDEDFGNKDFPSFQYPSASHSCNF